jgi:hypothetical protein
VVDGRNEGRLNIPAAAVSASIRVIVQPPSAAILISNAIMGDEAVRFDGPFAIGHIPTDSPVFTMQGVDGATGCQVQTLAYEIDPDGSVHARRDAFAAKGKPYVKPAIEGERERFYAAIGRAVSQWQHVEAALAHIFGVLLIAEQSFASSAAFFAAINFGTKLDMVDAAAQSRFLTQPSLLEEWRRLQDEARRKSNIRNNFAHYTCAIRVTEQDKYRYYLEPTVLNPNNYRRPNAPAYNYVNIENEARSFGETARKLMEFLPQIVSSEQSSQTPPSAPL